MQLTPNWYRFLCAPCLAALAPRRATTAYLLMRRWQLRAQVGWTWTVDPSPAICQAVREKLHLDHCGKSWRREERAFPSCGLWLLLSARKQALRDHIHSPASNGLPLQALLAPPVAPFTRTLLACALRERFAPFAPFACNYLLLPAHRGVPPTQAAPVGKHAPDPPDGWESSWGEWQTPHSSHRLPSALPARAAVPATDAVDARLGAFTCQRHQPPVLSLWPECWTQPSRCGPGLGAWPRCS